MHELPITLRAESALTSVRPVCVARRSQGWQCAVACMVAAGGCASSPDAGTPTVEACVAADDRSEATAAQLCEHAWRATGSEDAAVAGAHHALYSQDGTSLHRWASRALPTIQGARILHYWAERLRSVGDLNGAEATLRQVLRLRVDLDPARATNTALALLALVKSHQPAEDSMKLVRLAWEQAERSHESLSHAFAAAALVETFVDLGELAAAETVIRWMDPHRSGTVRQLAEGRLRAAQGRLDLAVALFKKASHPPADDPGGSYPLGPRFALVHSLLDLGRLGEARIELDAALEIARQHGTGGVDIACRLAAAEAAVLAAEGYIDAALASVERGLALSSRDAARVMLLNVRGDALALRGDFATAEQTWRSAADSMEAWRASIPSSQLRTGLVAHHRHALEAWLDSTASRGDVAGALEVTRRLIGRVLLDRIQQREAGANAASPGAPEPIPAAAGGDSALVDASIDAVVRRLETDRELAATLTATPDLRGATHDMVAIMSGAHSIWAIRRVRGSWSVDRVGDRTAIVALVDAYRRLPDGAAAAEQLGAAMFPPATLPTAGAALVVLLDREFADVALAGLRVGGDFLVQHAPILELLAPALVFAPLPERRWEPPAVIGDAAGNLPSAAREVAAVAGVLEVEPHVGAGATRNALAAGGRARVLHVATHATLWSGGAALALSDGALTSREIVGRKIAPRLAVIATCQSQIDDDPATSLAAAFLAAGAGGVVGVKRSLGDRDGAELMLGFYRAGGAADPLHALAAAQRAAIADNRPPHAWATVSFFGVGGWL